MPTVLTEAPREPMNAEIPRKRWTREECKVLEGTGLFDGQDFELIGGELINRRMGKNRPHAISLLVLRTWLVKVFGAYFVESETSIDVSPEDNPANQPEPDLIVVKRDARSFRAANPRPEDIQLLIEVADSTRNFDLTIKASLYARAGIEDYWVLDIPNKMMVVHRHPSNGKYTSVAAYGEDESVAPLAAPNAEFAVREAF